MNNTFENLGLVGLNLDSFTNIEKGKKFPIGTISNGYKKIAEGKWQKVSELGKTRKEHIRAKDEANSAQAEYSRTRNHNMVKQWGDEVDRHDKYINELDDKEYSDDHVENSGKYKKEKFGRPTKEDLQEYFQKHGKHLDSSTKSLIHRDEYETTVSKNQFGRLSMEIKHKEKGHTSYSGPVDEKSELYQKNKHLLGEESKKSEEAKKQVSSEDYFEKGKKMPIGTISNGYKKIAEGKWQKVSKHGLTKKEHFDKVESHQKSMAQAAKNNDDDLLRHHEDKEREHYDEGVKLDNKEYDDVHVIGKKENKQADDKDEKEGLKENENYDKFLKR